MKNGLNDRSICIKNHKDTITNIEELTEEFDKYVYKNLVDKKLNENTIKQYYAANPPNMSVTGLLRYWNKKQ